MSPFISSPSLYSAQIPITATCSTGIEKILQNEIEKLGGKIESTDKNMVTFRSDIKTLYKINMAARTAIHVFLRLRQFFFQNVNELYQKVKLIPWEEHFTAKHSIRIDIKGTSHLVNNTHFAIQKIKEAVADRFRETIQTHPSVSKEAPDIQITLYIKDNKAIVYLDSSGAPLFKRGYRSVHGLAPLKEDLAAGILLLSRWDQKSNLLDPMCGSGTFLFEGYMIANQIPPNLHRKFAFMNWLNYKESAYQQAKQELAGNVRKTAASFLGYDNHENTVKIAETIRKTHFKEAEITILQKDFRQSKNSFPHYFIVTNPPYGERMKTEIYLNLFYKEIGNFLKQKCNSAAASIFTGNLKAAKSIGLRIDEKIKLYNGPIESRLLNLKIY